MQVYVDDAEVLDNLESKQLIAELKKRNIPQEFVQFVIGEMDDDDLIAEIEGRGHFVDYECKCDNGLMLTKDEALFLLRLFQDCDMNNPQLGSANIFDMRQKLEGFI